MTDDQTLARLAHLDIVREFMIPGSLVRYVEIPEASVPMPSRRAASAAWAFARKDLGLPAIDIRWFDTAEPDDQWTPPPLPHPRVTVFLDRPADGGPRRMARLSEGVLLGGLCDAGLADTTIWVRRAQARTYRNGDAYGKAPALEPWETALTVLHEAQHARDAIDLGPTTLEDHAEREARALAYGDRHRRLANDMGRPGWPQRRA